MSRLYDHDFGRDKSIQETISYVLSYKSEVERVYIGETPTSEVGICLVMCKIREGNKINMCERWKMMNSNSGTPSYPSVSNASRQRWLCIAPTLAANNLRFSLTLAR